MNKFFSATAVAALLVCSLTACGSSETATSNSSASATSSASASQGVSLEVTDAWIKATSGSMTGVFGKIKNNGGQTVTIVSVQTPVSDMNQLHTTETDSSGSTKMKEVESFEIEPGQTFELVPGGNHLMLMGMQCSLPAGSESKITLTDSEGATYDFIAEVRDYSAAQEEYAPGEEASTDANHSHDSEDHHEHGSHSHGEHSMPVSLPECK